MKYGLIGEKLGHSFSKIVHSELADYDYELKEIAKEELDGFLKKADFNAINVTIPYKQDVIPYLSFMDDTAKMVGAVNTIVNNNGKLYGYNTDFLGLKSLIEHANIKISDKKVLILGSGGTSKTALAVTQSMGAKEVYRVSRSGGDGLITYSCAETLHNNADVIINTTPCGMYPNNNASPIDINKFTNVSGVVDVIYNPLNSMLITAAKAKGINAVGGLYMLVAQAVFAAEKFLDTTIDKSKIDDIYKKIFLQKRNLVLVGMPSCGKTTIGKTLAEMLSKNFLDSDEEIVKRQGVTIPKIFEEKGEKYFRNIESEVIAELSKRESAVISTGGGAVLNRKNIENLKQNGLVVFIDRPLEMLVSTDDRPLSSNRELLEKRYNERYNIYCECSDLIIKNDCELEKVISNIKEAFLNENSCN